MSIRYLNMAFDAELPTGLKFTLVALCDYVDQNGQWRIKHETLAKRTGQSRRTICTHIQQLVRMEVLEATEHRHPDGRKAASTYKVNSFHLAALQSEIDAGQSETVSPGQSEMVSHQLPPEHLPPSTDGADAPAGYAFEGKVIRLTPADYERWERSYPNLYLGAELESRDAWLAGQPPDVQKRWFPSTATYLKNQNAKAPAKGAAGGGAAPERSVVSAEAEQWRTRVRGFFRNGFWLDEWGLAPSEPDRLGAERLYPDYLSTDEVVALRRAAEKVGA